MNPFFSGRALSALLFLSLLAVSPVLLSASGEPQDDPVAQLEADSARAFEEGSGLRAYNANMKLLNHRPYEAQYFINIVRAAAMMGRRSVAYHFMLQMQQQGLSYDFNQLSDTESIRDSEAYVYINDLLIEAGKAAGEGEPAFELTGPASDVGAIAWDSERQRFLVGTLAEGKLLSVADGGESEVLFQSPPEAGPWSIGGLAVDSDANRLWMASSATPKFHTFSPIQKSGHAVFEFALDSLELLARHDLPADELSHDLGSVAVTGNGHVYVIDRAQPIVFHLAQESGRLEPFVASTDLVRLVDLAVTPDNSRVFAADAAKGIWVIDPVARQAGMLTGPETLNLGGITGLEYAAGMLFVTQGASTPQRLLRLQLDATGSQAAEISPMAIALESYDGPGVGEIRDEALFYVANAASSDPDARSLVMRTPLDAGSQIEPPDLRQFQKSLKESQKQ